MSRRSWATAELFLVTAAATLSVIEPSGATWWAALASLPVLIRRLIDREGRQISLLDLFASLFLLSVMLSARIGYDPGQSDLKAARLVLAVLLMYAVLDQPDTNRTVVTRLQALLGLSIVLAYALSNNLVVQQADFTSIGRIRELFEGFLSRKGSIALDPNLVAGVLIFILPGVAAQCISGFQCLRKRQAVIYLTATAVLLAGLLLTSSRGAWLALLLALPMGYAGMLVLRSWLRGGWRRLAILAAILLLAFLLPLGVSRSAPMLGRLVTKIPGAPTAGERIGLYKDALDLAADYSFIGGGLASFAGHYSRYIRIIPFYFFRHAHDLYLNLAVEQGVPGLILAASILLLALIFSLRSLAARLSESHSVDWEVWAGIIGLIAVMLHGLVDDPLYGSVGTPLVFLPAALALYYSGVHFPLPIQGNHDIAQSTPGSAQPAGTSLRWTALILGFAILVIGMGFWRQLAAGLEVNLAAVSLAKAELKSWKGEIWTWVDDAQMEADLRARLASVLELEPGQETALHRLGHLAFSQEDFSHAVNLLLRAHSANPSHRGISKQLGYALLWSGDVNQGVDYLVRFPETRDELSSYIWWWQSRGESELSRLADEAAAAVAAEGFHAPE